MLDKYNYNDTYSIFGYKVVCNQYMMDIVQARTHKKKRINKKWRKRYGVKEVPWNKILIMNDEIHVHPKWFDKLKAEIDMKNINI